MKRLLFLVSSLGLSVFSNAGVTDNCVADWPKHDAAIQSQINEIKDATQRIPKDPYLASDQFRSLPGDYTVTAMFFDTMVKDRSCLRRLGVSQKVVEEKVEMIARITKYSKCGFRVSEISALTQEIQKIKGFLEQAKTDSERAVLKEILDERIYSTRRIASRYSRTLVCSVSKEFKDYLKSVPKELLELSYSLADK